MKMSPISFVVSLQNFARSDVIGWFYNNIDYFKLQETKKNKLRHHDVIFMVSTQTFQASLYCRAALILFNLLLYLFFLAIVVWQSSQLSPAEA